MGQPGVRIDGTGAEAGCAIGACADITDARALRQLEVEREHAQCFRLAMGDAADMRIGNRGQPQSRPAADQRRDGG